MTQAAAEQDLTALSKHFESSKELLHSSIPYLPVANPQEHLVPVKVESESDHNALMAAAATLIAYLSKLRDSNDHAEPEALRLELIDQIKSFEVRAQATGIFTDTILIARYTLCSALDETIMQTSWGQRANWQQQTLLEHFQGEPWGGERFFHILERLKTNPEQHINLLELMYTVLSLGYEGKYQNLNRNDYTLDRIIDELFQIIRHYRGDFNKDLVEEDALDDLTSEIQALRATQAQTHHPIWLVLLLTASVIFTIYAGFSYMLSSSIHPLYKTANNMLHTTSHHSTMLK